MRLFKNVDLCDLAEILKNGVLPISESGNDNWEDGKRSENSKDDVYLFAPTSGVNSFPEYGAALLEVEADAEPSDLMQGDNHTYKEYICKRVEPDHILKIYVPAIFKNRLAEHLDQSLIAYITFVDFSAITFSMEQKSFVPASASDIDTFGKTANFWSSRYEDMFMRGKSRDGVFDLYDYTYKIGD